MLPQMTLYNVGAAPIIAKLCRIAGIQEAVNQHVQYNPAKSKISPGLLIESMIINILSDRQPLYRLKSFWENQDLNLLFGIDGLDAGQFNDDAYGRSLDKLADAEPFQLISSVCLNMAKAHDIPIKQLHFDTTSKSVQGVYESTTEDPLVTLGHSKDHRPDLKQIKFGCGVTKEGLPVLGEVLPGNTSDQVWNPEAILKAKAYFENNGYKDIIFVGDCATVQSEENLLSMSNLRFISRFSERFNLASELKLNAFASEEPWLYLDEQKQVIPSMNESTQWSYRMKEFDRMIENKQLRFIVIESGSLIEQRLKKLEKSIIKQTKQLEKTIKKVTDTAFACEADALQACMDLVKHIEKENFICKYSVTQEKVKSYGQVGRPKKNAIAQTITQYKVIIEQVQIEPSYHEKLLRNEKSFILVTSLLDRNEYSMDAILKEYKQQNNIEQVFRFLKDPIYLGAVYLKDEKRIKGLGYVFMLVLLIGCYLQHRVRQSLEERNEVLEVSKGVTHKRPTVKSIIEAIKNTLIIEMNGSRYFDTSKSRNTVLFKVIDLVGFKPNIYLHYVE